MFTLHTEDGTEVKFSDVRLLKTDKSKNGYYIWVNGECIVTRGPIKVKKEKHGRVVTVLVPIAADASTFIEG